MEELEITRRRFAIGTTAAVSASLAGCLSGDDDESGNGDENGDGNETDGEENGDESDNETDGEGEQEEEDEEPERGELVVHLEDENGDPVSEGITFKAVPNGDEGNTLLMQSFSDGQGSMSNVAPGSYTATAEGDGFETVEDEMTIEAGEETELTLVLEGAAGEDNGSDDE